MKTQIEAQFVDNLDRVRNLVRIYEVDLATVSAGTRGKYKTDVLRAATVLLHATLEDLLRSLAYWKLPRAPSAILDNVPLAGRSANQKFSLSALADHRGKTVDELIEKSVDAHLERSSYGNTAAIASVFLQIGLDIRPVQNLLVDLEVLMSRRHQIVHRADIDSTRGVGNRVNTITITSVEKWINTVAGFGAAALSQL
jgi:hypothetical protein